MTNKTLYVAITGHGYGHLGQIAPVLNELDRRMPGLRVVVESVVPAGLIAQRLAMPFDHVCAAADFGMAMKNALEIDVAASHERYAAMHARANEHVEAARRRLAQHEPDLLLANVPYFPLRAARAMALPAMAMCSLNWADIYGAACAGMPGAAGIHADMAEAYRCADAFIVPAPGMDMPGLSNVHRVGPVAALGAASRGALAARLEIAEGERLVAVSMGGIATDLPLARWPVVPGVTWLFDRAGIPERRDIVAIATLGLPFLDVTCAADALLTKPGYGAFAEAACNGVPVLYVPRPDWPEAPYLTRWLHARGRCLAIDYGDLASDRLGARLAALWRLPRPPRIAPTGIAEAAEIIAARL